MVSLVVKEMEKSKILKIMKEKMSLGWNFEKIYSYICYLDNNEEVTDSSKRGA